MRHILTIALLFLALVIVKSQSIKSPEEFLGYKVGTDYKIADYETITKYFKQLIGKLHKKFIMKISAKPLWVPIC